jgi:hypothetical protein
VDYGDNDGVLGILFCVLFSDHFACFLALGWRWKVGKKALPTRICLVHVCHDTQLSYNENKMHTTNELNNARLPCGRTIDEIRDAVAAGKVS